MTYKDFARQFGFDHRYPPAWANRTVLDAVAAALKNDPQVAIDLTFLIRNAATKYPSVIDGKPFDRSDGRQKQRARKVADDIIKKYQLTAPNPY